MGIICKQKALTIDSSLTVKESLDLMWKLTLDYLIPYVRWALRHLASKIEHATSNSRNEPTRSNITWALNCERMVGTHSKRI